jgi:hypothetical protein
VGGYCAHCQTLRALELEQARQRGQFPDEWQMNGSAPPVRTRSKHSA